MTRRITLCPLAAAVCLAATAGPASAQLGPRQPLLPVAQVASISQADLRGLVLDERGRPLANAVVSALGATTAFAVSDGDGRFVIRNLPFGPYLVRAHLQGYLPARGRIIQVDQSSHGVSTIALTRRGDEAEAPQVLTAGVGPADVAAGAGDESGTHDHSETAWWLRHLPRSVLKDATTAIDLTDDDSFLETPFSGLGWAVGTPARVATSLFSEIPFSGQVNLLTRTSFDRPQDLFSAERWLPGGVAFLTLEAPTGGGDWTMRGAITQGDLSSWILAGSYVRRPSGAHRYQAGMSYGMQRYQGGNADALAAVSDGGRNVGAMYAYDDWAVNSRLSVSYGAKYARYDYLATRGLLSPRASVTVAPAPHDTFRVRATLSRRAVAPGAEEFIPPSTGLWLPPERTFSTISTRNAFVPEHIDHLEVAAERSWAGDILVGVRAFRQNVDDQLVTLFGVGLPDRAAASVGHYYVASGGDVDARGWGVSVSREVSEGIRASVDYTRVDSTWSRRPPDVALLSSAAASVLRDEEHIHDVTTSFESLVPVTDTRLFVVYKVNTGFADASAPGARAGTRFDVQVNQSLPFMNFTSAQWEMLVAVRSLFREALLDASVYDELLVLRPPKRIVGGVTVRF
ncbi:MAG: TonB-dependent receptor [Acidobacteria bacterium]|nr:TonB-dependent receptor [Acidobacteriota bacterium]